MPSRGLSEILRPGARDEEKERDVRYGENRGRNLNGGGKAGGKSANDIPASY